MGQFAGKAVIVTGGNSGIGKAAALAFAREGARVAIGARSVNAGRETVELIETEGGQAIFVQCDVTRTADVERLVACTVATFGRLDIAFNNAGIAGDRMPLAELTEEQFERVVDVNVKGVWRCMKHEIPAMLKTGGGCIVNCSSTAAFKTGRGLSSYTTTKAALLGMTKAAAVDYARLGIRVNAVCPSIVDGGMAVESMRLDDAKTAVALAKAHPMGRLCRVEEVAQVILWLCSDGASFVTGEALLVDGGFLSV
ncbi:MAG: glucose 1-dehydrogenase [Terriglobales bacterium]